MLGTPASQQELVRLASEEATAADVRSAAVERFAESVKKYGILLTAAEIERQYDRYNQSAASPPETQKILGAVLDVIESRVKKAPPANPPTANPSQANESSEQK